MNRIIGVIGVIACMLMLCSVSIRADEIDESDDFKLFLPIISTSHELGRPAGPSVCMGWGNLNGVEMFDAHYYFNSGSWKTWQSDSRALPVIRVASSDPAAFSRNLEYLAKRNYRGFVILHNEPDMKDQDNLSPVAAAGTYELAKMILPQAIFITPNTISRAYLDRFLAVLGDNWRESDYVGVHIYQGQPTIPKPHTWPDQWLAQVDDIVKRHGISSRVVLSEFGVPEIWDKKTQTEYYMQVFQSNVAMACAYTSVPCGGWAPFGCGYDLLDKNGDLTQNGQSLYDIVR